MSSDPDPLRPHAHRAIGAASRRTGGWLVTLLLAWLPAGSASAQPSIQTVKGTPSCGGCRIELTRVVTLGNPSDSVLLTERSQPVRDQRGRYYAWSAERGRIAVYDSAGRFLRTFGKRGQGPEEFAGEGRIVPTPGDSVRVYALPKQQVFGPDYGFVRVAPLPSGTYGNVLPLRNGAAILPTRVRGSPGSDHPLHILSADGSITRSFGARPGASIGSCSTCAIRSLAPSLRGGYFWGASSAVYRVEEWTTAGDLARALVIEGSPWFPTSVATRIQAGELRANRTIPYLSAVWQDEDGLVWVLGAASLDGKIDASAQPQGRGIGIVRTDDPATADRRRNLVDVIDPRTNAVLASRWLDGGRFGVIGNGLLYSTRHDADGYAYVDVWRLSLRRAPR